MLDLLLDAEQQDPDFELDEETCIEIDREFVQYYQRRVACCGCNISTELCRMPNHNAGPDGLLPRPFTR